MTDGEFPSAAGVEMLVATGVAFLMQCIK